MKDKTVNKSGTLPPEHVRERLSKDVHAILSVCLHNFEAGGKSEEEECFDVDAIIEGRAMRAEMTFARRVTPAAYARPTAEMPTRSAYTLTVPRKGYFIPSAFMAHSRFAAA